jgi:hypothetical protein
VATGFGAAACVVVTTLGFGAALGAAGAVDGGGAEVAGVSCDGELRSTVVGCDVSLVATNGAPAPTGDGVPVLAQPVTARASAQASRPMYPHLVLVACPRAPALVPDPDFDSGRADRFCGILPTLPLLMRRGAAYVRGFTHSQGWLTLRRTVIWQIRTKWGALTDLQP